jgi:hypothetical protein
MTARVDATATAERIRSSRGRRRQSASHSPRKIDDDRSHHLEDPCIERIRTLMR